MMLEGVVKRMVKVDRSNGMLAVTCPYSKSFVSFAKMRGGKWSDGTKQWMFDERDEFAIRSTLIDIYGTDDYESCTKVDVRVELDNMWSLVKNRGRLFFLGRELVRRRYYDNYVTLGTGVVVIEGGFPRKGGEYREPELKPEDGTILEVRDVPVAAAEAALREWPEAVTVLGQYDIEALQAERDFHAKRIAELDTLIARYSGVFQEDEIIADLQDDDDEPPEGGSSEAVAG